MADRERTAELVLRSRRGNRAAFAELVRRYENAAYATALTYTHHVEDAQDIVQDAFVIAYCKLAQLREPEHFGTWLGTIVRCQALEWLRREQADRFAHEASETVVGDLADLAWVCGRTSTSSGVVRPIFSDVKGSVCLLDTPLGEASGVHGRFLQSYYQLGGTETSEEVTRIRKVGTTSSSVRNVTGDVMLDLGRVQHRGKRPAREDQHPQPVRGNALPPEPARAGQLLPS